MSASLVGSEMCIRDRVPAGPQGEASSFRAWNQQKLGIPSVADMGTYRAAVSYTHLTLPTICSV
eukprot:3745447-Alexandrium_andersonii.AAC.1